MSGNKWNAADPSRRIPSLSTSQLLTGTVLPQADGLGVTLSVTNTSGDIVAMRLPNPYTGLQLFELHGTPLRGSSLLAWEQNDPRLLIHPQERVTALLKVSPFWTDIQGEVLAKCRIVCRFATEKDDLSQCLSKNAARGGTTLYFDGRVTLNLKTSQMLAQEIRARQSSSAPAAQNVTSGCLLNVSDYVIIDGSTKETPVRPQPTPLWDDEPD